MEKEKIINDLKIQIEKLKEQINNLTQKPKSFDLIIEYKNPSLKGLENIGSTCYMNATLQCFSQTKVLTEYFLDPSHEDIIKKGLFNINHNGLRLADSYYQVVSNLWKIDGNKTFAPRDFKYVLGTLNPLFQKMEASDAKDMIVFFLEQIHKEINRVNPPKIAQANPNLNQYNRDNMLTHFIEDFQKNNRSKISDNFFIIAETTQECQNCKIRNVQNRICYNYNIQNLFIFPLEEVRKFRNDNYNNQLNLNQMQMMQMMQMMQNTPMNPMMLNAGMNVMNMMGFQNINTNEVNIYDCFDYNQKDDLMNGDNQIYCNLCKQKADSIYGNKILTLPDILIMILNRGKNNVYKVRLNFYEEIDLTKYVLNAQENFLYTIYGVITHIGESGESGHFIASCKSPLDNNWYRYNDSIVSPITNFNQDIHNFNTPYILFYQRKK